MKNKLFVVAALFSCSHSFAQNSAADSLRSLDQVIVTANKYPKKQSETGKVVTVINRNMLDNLGGRTLAEVLNIVAGTNIIGANANLGTNQRLSIRGSGEGNVLLLIDGIPANDPSTISNSFDLNFFNTALIERIEVLKGGQSTLYGSDAVAGVVNIITRRTSLQQNQKPTPFANLSYGSYQTLNASAGVSGGGKAQYNLMGGIVSSEGFSSAFDSTGKKDFDKDGFRQYMLRGTLNIPLSQAVQLQLHNQYSYYRNDADAGAFTDDKDFYFTTKNWQPGAGLQWKQGRGNLQLNYRYNYVNRFYFDDSTSRSGFAYFSKGNYTGRTHYVELYESYRWNKVELLAGIDYRRFSTDQSYFSISSFGPYDPTFPNDIARMWQVSPYASLVYKHKGLNVEVGGRWNKHSTYGDNFTYTLNPSYNINSSVKVFANLSSAFKTPSLYQLFDPFIGNLNLGAEKTTVTEGGVDWRSEHGWQARATAFYRNTNKAIQYVIVDPVTYEGRYVNVDKISNSGGELELWYNSAKWNVYTAYTYTKGSVTTRYDAFGLLKTSDTTFNNLYRVPAHAISSSVSYTINKRWMIGTLLKYAGKRLEPVYAQAPKELASYFTADLNAQYHVSNKVRAFVDLKNIGNTEYFDVLGYNNRRFNFTLGLNIHL